MVADDSAKREEMSERARADEDEEDREREYVYQPGTVYKVDRGIIMFA